MSHVVECHSEFAYAERPTALTWDGKRMEVQAVLAAWRTPGSIHFRVRTNDRVYELAYSEADDDWHIQLP
jgi:hypothetical protein